MVPAVLAMWALLVLTWSLGCASEAPPPGYAGAVLSSTAQNLVGSLRGHTFHADGSAFGDGVWTVGPFGVIPNPVSGKGPVVLIHQNDRTCYLPMESDGDAADLFRRVHGDYPKWLSMEYSSNAYIRMWKGDKIQ